MRYVALLRAITNVAMAPFRAALEELGHTDVKSFGMSGNFIFTAATSSAELERTLSERFRTPTFIRTAAQMTKVAAADPFADQKGATVLFLAKAPAATGRKALAALDIENPRPIIAGKAVYCLYPVTITGKRAVLDLERILGVPGTLRSSRVVRRLAEQAAE